MTEKTVQYMEQLIASLRKQWEAYDLAMKRAIAHPRLSDQRYEIRQANEALSKWFATVDLFIEMNNNKG